MNQDSFLEVGSQHKVCEDFIISGTDPCPYVILSDGCSASENSNYGAMILVQMAKRYLDFRKHELAEIPGLHYGSPPGFSTRYYDMGHWVIWNAFAVVRSMGLNQTCLDATLIVSYLWDGFVYVYVYGDGYIITESFTSTGFAVYEVSFLSDSPYYLSYETDYFRWKAYKNIGYLKTVKYGLLDGESRVLHKEDSDRPLYYKFDFSVFKEIYVSSDGINSFIRNGEKLPVKDVISGFLDTEKEDRDRGTKGVFIQRRCRKAIRGFRKEGWDHYDDISFGGFLCGTM